MLFFILGLMLLLFFILINKSKISLILIGVFMFFLITFVRLKGYLLINYLEKPLLIEITIFMAVLLMHISYIILMSCMTKIVFGKYPLLYNIFYRVYFIFGNLGTIFFLYILFVKGVVYH